MSNPKEKAFDLVDKFYQRLPLPIDTGTDLNWDYVNWNEAKQCALIVVDEILLANPHINPFNTYHFSTFKYWQDVKQGIENL
jgi:hypothetical protein